MSDYVPYWQKLRDPRWQEKRLRIMERDEFKCRLCGCSEKTLNVHHAFYEKGRDPWDYDERFLRTFCEECHAAWHEWQNCLLAVSGFLTSADMLKQLVGFAKGLASSYVNSLNPVQFNLIDEDEKRGFAYFQFLEMIPFYKLELGGAETVTTDSFRPQANNPHVQIASWIDTVDA